MASINLNLNMSENALSVLTNRIVSNRKAKRNSFASIIKKVEEVERTLETVHDIRLSPLWPNIIEEAKCETEWEELIREFDSFQTRFDKYVACDGLFTIAKERLKRKFVNVGAIGITREGKSQFTTKVTGLDIWVIPTRSGEPCTTAPINVINGSTEDHKTAIARVYYYSVSEMSRLLNSFLVEIAGGKPFNKSIELIANQLLECKTRDGLLSWCNTYAKTIRGDQSLGITQASKKLSFLTYLDNIESYIDRLVESSENKLFEDYPLQNIIGGGMKNKSEKLSSAELYYSSVSYYVNPNSTDPVYTSYATKYAEVYTTFSVGPETVSDLQFLDTPGIGEQKPGLNLILSESISMKLDIILVIRAVTETVTNKESLEKLIHTLKTKFDGKHTSKDILYFILNMWDGVKYQRGVQERTYIQNSLGLSLDKAGAIVLDDNHFRMINVRDGVELIDARSTNSNNPLGNYLYSIFSNLIPQIEAIDNDFCMEAENEFSELEKLYELLKRKIEKLDSKLPNYSDYGRIKSIIVSFHKALMEKGAYIPKIMTSVKYPINEYCKEPAGSAVAKFFGIDSVSALENPEAINAFVEAHHEKISRQDRYDEGSWNLGLDFQKYESLKKEFCEQIMADLRSKINQKDADRIIAETKEKIANVFIDSGRITMFGSYDDSWWSKLVNGLEKEGNSSLLNSLCKEFGLYEIDALDTLKDAIERVASNCKHCDNFGEGNDFVEFFNACVSIIHSLVQIEKKAKKSISEGSIKQRIEGLEQGFKMAFLSIARLGAGNSGIETTPIWDELYAFYERHSAEVFTDDVSQKRGLVKRWTNLIG